MERWRPIPGFEGYYAVSDYGRFRSLSRTIVDRNGLSKRITGRIMRPSRSHGYVSFVLWKDHRQTTMRAHHAVALAFIGQRPEGAYVCHKDGDRQNNHLGNLYYGTPKQNVDDMRRHGTMPVGEKSGAAKLRSQQVVAIRKRRASHSQEALAREFGISQAQVSRIISGRHWRGAALGMG